MRCRWFLFALAVVVACGSSALAQPPIQPRDGKFVVPLAVDATALPKPALKYTLLPELRDGNPGNQIPAYYKCFMEQYNLYRHKDSIDYREKWIVAPLAELKGEKGLVGYGGSSTRQADYAARLDYVDWGITTQLKTEGIFLLLPDVQQLRELAQVLKLKLRGEIARGEFDTALRTAQTLLALARAFESHPTLIGQLVGIAITSLTFDALDELVQQPGAPNLYWALSDLPAPFMSLRKGMEGERAWLGKEFDVLRKPDRLSVADFKNLTEKLDPILKLEGKEAGAMKVYRDLADDKKFVAEAVDRLAGLGFPKDKVATLDPVQAVMADDFMQYEVFRDELLKWTNFPYWQIPEDALKAKTSKGVFTQLPPSLVKVKQAQARIQQRIDMLRVAEAVRAHAGDNAGKLPAALDAIKLPLPVDPVTGKPFGYELKDGKAVLRGTPPADRAKEPVFNRVYEITVRK